MIRRRLSGGLWRSSHGVTTSWLNLHLSGSAGSLLKEEKKHESYRLIRRAGFVDVKMKWVRDRGLDHAVEKEKHLRPTVALKNLIKREPRRCLPVSIASEKKDELGLPTRAIEFIRRYPSVFEEFTDAAVGKRPLVRLTAEAIRLDEEEQRVLDSQKQDAADRLLKLLMMTGEKRLPLRVIDQLMWDLGLPDDYARRLVPDFPDYFEIVDLGPPRHDPALELVCWSKALAVSVMEKNAIKADEGGYRKGMPLAFPMNFSTGFDLEKKVKRWVDEWQKLPYISPYEDASHLHPKSDLGEKWMVGVLHELFHLFISKKTERNNVLALGEHLGFRPRFARAFAHHPGIFYVSNKLKTCTVILREAYKRDLLIEKHPMLSMRFQYIRLLKMEADGGKNAAAVASAQSESSEDEKDEDDEESESDGDGDSSEWEKDENLTAMTTTRTR
ncbi:protein WHAT'S THIS FACTOR 9, mitochondrial-like [Nymphaea colorata]|uniref:PORR domain-containing protein n=1 Tax=Nymphaea colorata TaxID=210225 RepID=A0A5K1D883_9MAGN|nr:protein WHAT'S THIS FACTOR 9, mitochondrial-like [Nymphaea colorata]